jgi:hypothetical protein
MPEPLRTGYIASWPVLNGRLYCIGGEAPTTGITHEFTPDENGGTYREVESYPTPIHGIGPIAVDGKIYVAGGGTGGGVSNKTAAAYVFTIEDLPVSAAPGNRGGHAARMPRCTVVRADRTGVAVSIAGALAAPTHAVLLDSRGRVAGLSEGESRADGQRVDMRPTGEALLRPGIYHYRVCSVDAGLAGTVVMR